MPVKRQISARHGVYFITFTCYRWKYLLSLTNAYDLIYFWFDHLKNQGHYIIGYVIMPNHIHILIAFRDTGQSINIIVGNGKRFIAYGIIKRLREQENPLLSALAEAVKNIDKKRNKKHEVWERSFDWKECRSDQFIQQKLNYMHQNPCKGKWALAASPVEYPHSSLLYYSTGEQGIYPVFNYQQVADVNLTEWVVTNR